MKRERTVCYCVILILVCVCAALLVSSLSASAEQRKSKFDVNEDGSTDVGDVTSLLNHLAAGCTHRPTWTGRLEPTCVSAGAEAHRVCALCGEAMEDFAVIEKTAHTVEIDEALAPTCTQPGKTEGSHCSFCGEILTAQQDLPPRHTPAVLAAVEPGCTEPGLTEGSVCSLCGEILTAQETVPALGHDYRYGVCTRCHDRLPVNEGDVILFGHYEQDNDQSNGKEAIEWYVLDVTDGRALLLSKYALDCMSYDPGYPQGVDWSSCLLRSRLNTEFLEEAFTESEQEAIFNTRLDNGDNPEYNTPGGGETTDKVFLLSLSDAVNTAYGFSGDYESDTARLCEPTEYAKARGCWYYGNPADFFYGCCFWWLRTPGRYARTAAGVGAGGEIDAYGPAIDDNDNGVRPSIVIDLNALYT